MRNAFNVGYARPMTRVAVITGGAGGIGLATARVVGRDSAVVLCDVRPERLDAPAGALSELGIDFTTVHCDVTNRVAVEALYATAAEIGRLSAVVHAAGVSPSMGGAEYVMRTNTLGTINVGEVFFATAP